MTYVSHIGLAVVCEVVFLALVITQIIVILWDGNQRDRQSGPHP